MNFRFLRAYGFFAGGIIGVGVFGLPAVLQRAGAVVFFIHVAVVSLLVWWIHRLYLDVVLATPGKHRLPGLARLHLSRGWGAVAAVVNLLGLVGALVAYLVAGGSFLSLLGTPFAALGQDGTILLYLLPGALLLLVGLRSLPALELVILALFLAVLAILPAAGWGDLSLTRVPSFGSSRDAFLPYGVLLFGFWGVSLVAESAELVRRNARTARAVLAAGMITAAIAYTVFALTVTSLTGQGTTEDALTGLRATFGDGVVELTLVFGLLTTFSSYLALGLTLLRTLELDFRVPRLAAWALTTLVPVGVVFAGVRSLLAVLGITGAVFLGIEGLVVLRLATRRVTHGARGSQRIGAVVAAVLLGAGVLGEIMYRLVF